MRHLPKQFAHRPTTSTTEFTYEIHIRSPLMIASTSDTARYEPQFDESLDAERFERFSHHRGGDFPVRSHASRTRAKMRGRATPAARNKSRSFNGSNRRGRGNQWSAVC